MAEVETEITAGKATETAPADAPSGQDKASEDAKEDGNTSNVKERQAPEPGGVSASPSPKHQNNEVQKVEGGQVNVQAHAAYIYKNIMGAWSGKEEGKGDSQATEPIQKP